MKTAPAPRSSQQRRLPSILDREIGDYTKDAFGHRHFAKALEDLIEDETKKPPFSIGMLGPWGTGKSTIKELYLERLRSDQSGHGQEVAEQNNFSNHLQCLAPRRRRGSETRLAARCLPWRSTGMKTSSMRSCLTRSM